MIRAPALLLILSLAVTGCAVSPRAQVRDRLIAAGLKPPMAECLADRLVRKLSPGELRTLGRIADGPRPASGHIGLGTLAERLRAVDDPHIVQVVTHAGFACAVTG